MDRMEPEKGGVVTSDKPAAIEERDAEARRNPDMSDTQERVDEEIDETFPASDPPTVTRRKAEPEQS